MTNKNIANISLQQNNMKICEKQAIIKQGVKRKGPYINLTEKLDRIDYCNGTEVKTIQEHMKEQNMNKHFLFGSQQILYGCSNLGCTKCSCIHFRKTIYKNR